MDPPGFPRQQYPCPHCDRVFDSAMGQRAHTSKTHVVEYNNAPERRSTHHRQLCLHANQPKVLHCPPSPPQEEEEEHHSKHTQPSDQVDTAFQAAAGEETLEPLGPYLSKDFPLQKLTDKILVEKVRTCVDEKLYPFGKYYSKQSWMAGPLQVAFVEMGWGRNRLEDAYKRARGTTAVIDVMTERVSDNREKSKMRCKKRFLEVAGKTSDSECFIEKVEEAFAVFSKGILQENCIDMSVEEGRQVFTVCYFLAGVQGIWNPEEKTPRYSSFHKAVTISDWAFGFMLLEIHHGAWLETFKQEKMASSKRETKRSRKDQQICSKSYHHWFGKIQEVQQDLDGNQGISSRTVDQWLIDRAKTSASSVQKQKHARRSFTRNDEGTIGFSMACLKKNAGN